MKDESMSQGSENSNEQSIDVTPEDAELFNALQEFEKPNLKSEETKQKYNHVEAITQKIE